MKRLFFPVLLAACGGKDTGTAPVPDCDATTPTSLAGCVDEARYASHLATVAVPREPDSDNWQRVQDLCATAMEEAGFTVERQVYDTGVNVVGTRTGSSSEPPVLLSAHYDSIASCDGADDNASGVAGVLEAARVLGWGRFTRTLVVACWDEEESGLIGSETWARAQADAGDSVTLSVVLEMIGYKTAEEGSQSLPAGFDLIFPEETAQLEAGGWKGDFIALVADEHASAVADDMVAWATPHGLSAIPLVLTDAQSTSRTFGDLRRSDHAPFWDQGWPAMMITDTSEYRYGGYHCHDFDDTVDQVDTAFATDVLASTVAAVARAAGLEGAR